MRFSLDNTRETLSLRRFAPEDTNGSPFELLSQGLREHRGVTLD